MGWGGRGGNVSWGGARLNNEARRWSEVVVVVVVVVGGAETTGGEKRAEIERFRSEGGERNRQYQKKAKR